MSDPNKYETFEWQQWHICYQIAQVIIKTEAETKRPITDAELHHTCDQIFPRHKFYHPTENRFKAVMLGGIALASSDEGRKWVENQQDNKYFTYPEDAKKIERIISEFVSEFVKNK